MTTRIFKDEMEPVLYDLFVKYGFSDVKAKKLSSTYTDSTLAGVNSHGINRVPLFIKYVKDGVVKVDAEAEKAEVMGSIERWDGHLGPGIINATKCTNRAIELAKKYGMGMVALRNTNHWMRAGTYAHQAAEAGCVSIMFTNTNPNMPPWGGKDSRIGNNPLAIAIPRDEGNIVLDMAISQFAFGKVKDYGLRGKQLPYFGGWDNDHVLTKDPAKILGNERGLPIGYWKGSALSMILDMLVTILSAGKSTYRVGQGDYEASISQVFMCIDPYLYNDKELQQKLLNEIIDYTHDVEPMVEGERTYYPGERSAQTKVKNLEIGMPVSDTIWQQVKKLLS